MMAVEGMTLAGEVQQLRPRAGAGVAEGDAARFETFVARHEPRVRRLAHRLLGWRGGDDVDDVVQDVFLAALEHLHRFRGDASIETWLTSVALNRCRTHRRRQLLRLRWFGNRGNHAAAAVGEAADRRAVADETSARVRGAVQALGAKDREVIVLFYLEEMPVARIAELLSISRGAVDVRLHRARRRLKEKLSKDVSS
jgi:RNA polymerase sigma-70 factor (ECF subfamily)